MKNAESESIEMLPDSITRRDDINLIDRSHIGGSKHKGENTESYS